MNTKQIKNLCVALGCEEREGDGARGAIETDSEGLYKWRRARNYATIKYNTATTTTTNREENSFGKMRGDGKTEVRDGQIYLGSDWAKKISKKSMEIIRTIKFINWISSLIILSLIFETDRTHW